MLLAADSFEAISMLPGPEGVEIYLRAFESAGIARAKTDGQAALFAERIRIAEENGLDGRALHAADHPARPETTPDLRRNGRVPLHPCLPYWRVLYHARAGAAVVAGCRAETAAGGCGDAGGAVHAVSWLITLPGCIAAYADLR